MIIRVTPLCTILITALALSSLHAEDTAPTKPGNPTAGIASATIAAAAATGTFFLIRRHLLNRRHGKAIIARCELCYSQAGDHFSRGEYPSARAWIDSVADCREQYVRFTTKWRLKQRFSDRETDSLRRRSKVLIELTPDIERLTATANALPATAEALVTVNKWPLKDTLAACRARVTALEEKYPDAADAVSRDLLPVVEKLNRVDSLFLAVYEQERNVFNLKSRFHYNQAIASRDSVRIRQFIADCDYYRSDRESCERARDLLRPYAVAKAFGPAPAGNTMQAEFAQAMATQRLDLLEAYIAKYSKRKKDALAANVEAVRAVYEQRKRELAAVQAYNYAHPPLSERSSRVLSHTVVGGNERLDSIISGCITGFYTSFSAGLGQMRFPASIRIDLTQSPPILLLNAFIHRERDVRKKPLPDSGIVVLEVTGAQDGLQFLNGLARDILEKSAIIGSGTGRGLEHANYAVRLWSSDAEYLTFYARSPGAGGDIQIFDFLDVTTKNQRDIRIRKADPFRLVLPFRPETGEKQTTSLPPEHRSIGHFFGLTDL